MLDNLSLKLDVGKSIAIVGPSGSGKSTLLNLILRLYTPDEGRVAIDGVDIRRVTRESLRSEHGGRVPGEHAVQHVDPGEHPARQGGRQRRGGRGGGARKAEIHSYIMSLPQQYDTPVGERGDTLSGGQRQRIAIARAIIRNPSRAAAR